MSKRSVIVLMAAVVAAAAIIVAWLGSAPTSSTSRPTARAALPSAHDPAQAGRVPAPAVLAAAPEAARETARAPAPGDDMVAHVRERYGKHIEDPYVQMKMLEALMRYFQKQQPERWREALLEVVRQAFPELYDEIAATLQGRLDYEAWMDESRDRLRDLDARARREALWEARNRIFGQEVAEQIWASELNNQAVADALATIDAHDGTIADKLSMYKQSLESVYQEQLDAYMQRHQHQAMNRFLGMESVQQALSAMSAAERARSLRAVREDMGLDQDALARWEELDRKRDTRWENGLAYMAERQALTERYRGAELEAQLDQLRARYFGAEADVIAGEEAAGFFRFDRQRRWGQN